MLATIGQLVEAGSLRRWQVDLEAEAGNANSELCIARSDLLARTLHGLFDRLQQGGCVPCSITRGEWRWLYALVRPPVRFPDAVIEEVDVGAIARKIVCHYDPCCR
ncbi:hypothetical protein VQ042_16470 [Aurantimonas sp. A2-1-M11]|uniref:hypothetical protein n=1 Tax=Aurantimonas sp. A2-1-M11 TaxID=3113712 RepID=UPI002F921397